MGGYNGSTQEQINQLGINEQRSRGREKERLNSLMATKNRESKRDLHGGIIERKITGNTEVKLLLIKG